MAVLLSRRRNREATHRDGWSSSTRRQRGLSAVRTNTCVHSKPDDFTGTDLCFLSAFPSTPRRRVVALQRSAQKGDEVCLHELSPSPSFFAPKISPLNVFVVVCSLTGALSIRRPSRAVDRQTKQATGRDDAVLVILCASERSRAASSVTLMRDHFVPPARPPGKRTQTIHGRPAGQATHGHSKWKKKEISVRAFVQPGGQLAVRIMKV